MNSLSNQPYQRSLAFKNSPRLGRSNQFSDLFASNDEAIEYVSGILVVALIISCFFFSWMIFLLILKCLGTSRVGYVSGGPYKATTDESSKDPNPRIFRGRIIFGLSSILFITFTLCLIFLGFGNLEETTDDMSVGARLGSDVFIDSKLVLGNLRDVAIEAANTRDLLVDVLQRGFETDSLPLSSNVTLPPVNKTLPPAAVIAASTTVDRFKYTDLQGGAAQVVETLYSLDDMIQEEASTLKDVLDEGEDTCNGVADGLDEAELFSLQLGFGIPYTVLPCIMLVVMALTAVGVNNSGIDTCTSFILIPLLSISVALLILLTAGFAIAGIVDADFCNGGTSHTPEETLRQIMDHKGILPGTLMYQSINYVISGCDIENPTSEFPLQFINDFEARLDVAEEQIRDFLSQLDTVGIPLLNRELSVNVTNLDLKLIDFRNTTSVMLNLLDSALKELACERIYAIYEQVIHVGTCESSTKGLNWTFAALLVMSFCGCMMLMWRASLYTPTGNDDDYSWNEVKEQEMMNEGPPAANDEGGGNYVSDDGLNTKPVENEAPMGGQAQQRYDAVGDENPFVTE